MRAKNDVAAANIVNRFCADVPGDPGEGHDRQSNVELERYITPRWSAEGRCTTAVWAADRPRTLERLS